MNPVRWWNLILACAVVAATAAHVSAAPDPYEIFSRARAYWTQQSYAPRIEYSVAVDVIEGGKERVERYASDYDAVQNVVDVDAMSDYERDHPTHVSGMDFGILFWRLNKPLPPADFLGVPQLAPSYSFGMAPFVPAPTPTPFNPAALVQQIRDEFHDPNPRTTPGASATPGRPLKEIAEVVARNHDYTIALLGMESVEGHDCYHLALKPTHDPGRYRIRQAWIDTQSFATWKLVDALNFVNGPGTSVPWTIHFTDIAGAHYISAEEAGAPMSTGGEIYTQAQIRFENLHSVSVSTLRPQIVEGGTRLEEPLSPGGKAP
jgi:hypothetical protein